MTSHVKKRMIERKITISNIQNAIRTGEIIEKYEDDKPFPSCLILGLSEYNKYIHTVVATDSDCLYVITAYTPDEDEWEINFKIRKGR